MIGPANESWDGKTGDLCLGGGAIELGACDDAESASSSIYIQEVERPYLPRDIKDVPFFRRASSSFGHGFSFALVFDMKT